ncbi:MAG: heme A synthase [Rhodospirillales bacterium]|nr:MAG: heme A synthase [Rhodospirillales bacterium]
MATAERAEQVRRQRLMALWLLGVAAMVFAMVVIGGLTRLTGSGLSMVAWRPVTGWLPPLSEAEWLAVFEAYRQSPEYLYVNRGMSLADFKDIFWLEYIHRLWGRLIGVAFAVPLIIFAVKGWIARWLAPHLVVALVLGGLQGALGWFMVQSGLVHEPAVSQYRLVAHLGAALAIYVYLLWLAARLLELRRPEPVAPAGARRGALAVTGLVTLTILSGGFVAGLDAGLIYNTFPLMGGGLMPPEAFGTTPVLLAPFEDAATAQFVHRVLALTTLAAVVALWVTWRRRPLAVPARRALTLLAGAVLVQVGLGIATLLTMVPWHLGALHQAGAVLVLTAAVWTVHQLRTGPAEAPAAVPMATAGSARP